MTYIECSTGRAVDIIKTIAYYQKDVILYLIEFQDNGKQVVLSQTDFETFFRKKESEYTTYQKLQLYQSLFKGRDDVYAKSYFNEDGKIQYYPSYDYGWRQLPSHKRTCQPLTVEIIKSHLKGEQIIGIFLINKDDTCWFLVIDLDEEDFREATTALREIAKPFGICPAVEISRSGNGVHLWFFFKEAVACHRARTFGKKLLELALQSTDKISFVSFDRLFPNQDMLPKGGFGNLISLPLQGESYQKGNTVFVDDQFISYPNQWEYLSHVQKLDHQDIYKVIQLEPSSSTGQQKCRIRLSNHIIFTKNELTPKTKFELQKLSSFANPEYYLKQAMRQPTYRIAERIYLFEETSDYLKLPRGLIDKVKEIVDLEMIDKRLERPDIKVSFNGELTFEQEMALSDLLSHENGVLQAETGFGKTVLASSLVAKRQKRTIVLVHNSQLLEQWLDSLERFLSFNEPLAKRVTPSGREKVIGHIGQFGSSKKWCSHLVDVVMIQSLFKVDQLETFLKYYDMMIVDECHHVSAIQFEKVVSKFQGKFLYGLTATPERKNGHEPIIFQRIGPIIHQAAKRQVEFQKQLNLRFTGFGKYQEPIRLSTNFTELNQLLAQDNNRNQQIVNDILAEYQAKRHILVVTNRIEHMILLKKLLKKNHIENLWVISGQSKKQERQDILERIQSLEIDIPFVLISTGKYIGEGFDLPQLDSLVLAGPLSWKNNLIQYAGRIHRHFESKYLVKIFDYIDIHVPYLEKMFHKRQAAYKKMDYQILQHTNYQAIFDEKSYHHIFDKDTATGKGLLIKVKSIDRMILNRFLSLVDLEKLTLVLPKGNRMFDHFLTLQLPKLHVIESQTIFSDTVVIIDNRIVWYGNFSLKEEGKNEDCLILRLESSELAQEFYEKVTNHL